jgi:8-oxo-dGTP pyrophosphatase MutT (NUDIX family)
MDYSSGNGCLMNIPDNILKGLTIRLDTDDDICDTFKNIEQCHWDYLDNYRDYNRRQYPGYKIHEFVRRVFIVKGINRLQDIHECLKLYNKYKKSLPTAGVIMYNNKLNNISFVTVRMKHTDIWSMPKGKKDVGDSGLLQTAIREFREETGVDLEECIFVNTPSKVINRTLFYLVESDALDMYFSGYDTNEISDVKWTAVADVSQYPDRYSKQVRAAAKYLNGL